jgi:hypothetical protein
VNELSYKKLRGPLNIDELMLRVPGLSPRDGEDLARRVLRKVERSLPDNTSPRSLAHVKVQLFLPHGLGIDELAARIARAVVEQLGSGGSS